MGTVYMEGLKKVMKGILGDNEITWICDQCNKPIENGQGYICTPYPQSGNKQEKPWKVLHAACDPDPDSSDYWIEIERINTWDKFYDWQRHLSEKRWFNQGLWDELLKKAEVPREIKVA